MARTRASFGDPRWMRAAIRQARAGTGSTYPNPCVGAVVVAGGVVVGQARSDITGGPHAEVRALRRAGAAARGATLYVTLEPCNHRGRTPPCVDAILEAGVARVCVGIVDPAEHVAGRGIRRLRRRGVEVQVGLEAEAAAEAHRHYLHHVDSGRPFVTLKVATSLDGRIATRGGDSKWITGEAARRSAHRLRADHHAIAVGGRTVRADDPRLSVRLVRGLDPVPVVFDPKLRCLAGDATPAVLRPGAIFLHTPRASARARRRVARAGAEAIELPADPEGRIGLDGALEVLGARAIRSLMVEGGGRLLGSFVRAGCWGELWHYQAPVILGEGRAAFAGLEWTQVADAPRLRVARRRRLGDDQLTIYTPA